MFPGYMWQTQADWPLRKGIVNEIRNFFMEKKSRLVAERGFPEFVKKLELVLYENAKSQEEYIDKTTLLERLKVHANSLSPSNSPMRGTPTDTSNVSGRTDVAVSDESSPEVPPPAATLKTESQELGVTGGQSSEVNVQQKVPPVVSRKRPSRPGKRRSDSIVENPAAPIRCKLSPSLMGDINKSVWDIPPGNGLGDESVLAEQPKEMLCCGLDMGLSGGKQAPVKLEAQQQRVGGEEPHAESHGSSTKQDDSSTQSKGEQIFDIPEVGKSAPWDCLNSSFDSDPLAGFLNDDDFLEPDFSSEDWSWLNDDFSLDKPNALDELQELEEHIAPSNIPQELKNPDEFFPPSPFGSFGAVDGPVPSRDFIMDSTYSQPQAFHGAPSTQFSSMMSNHLPPPLPLGLDMGFDGLGVQESVGSVPSFLSPPVPIIDVGNVNPQVCPSRVSRGSSLLMPNLISPRSSHPTPFQPGKEIYNATQLPLMAADPVADMLGKGMDPLSHAYECQRYPCTTMCEQLKRLFYHARSCVDRSGECESCKWLGLLMSVHARNCKSKSCRLPCCT